MTQVSKEHRKVTWLGDLERPELGITHGIVDGQFYAVASKGNTPGVALVRCAKLFKKMKPLGTVPLPNNVELVQVI